MSLTTSQMNLCCQSKAKTQITNEVFDLMDADGDSKVNENELAIVAKYIHQAAVDAAALHLEQLKQMDCVAYVHQLAGKKKLKIKDFAKLQFMVPRQVWMTQVLPELRKKEVNRLQSYN